MRRTREDDTFCIHGHTADIPGEIRTTSDFTESHLLSVGMALCFPRIRDVREVNDPEQGILLSCDEDHSVTGGRIQSDPLILDLISMEVMREKEGLEVDLSNE